MVARDADADFFLNTKLRNDGRAVTAVVTEDLTTCSAVVLKQQ